jgi:hypothetical protein
MSTNYIGSGMNVSRRVDIVQTLLPFSKICNVKLSIPRLNIKVATSDLLFKQCP